MTAPRGPFELLAFSCQYPAGLLGAPVAYGSMRRLREFVQGYGKNKPTPRAFCLGDLVYVDATAGLADPIALGDRYEVPYLRLFAEPTVDGTLGGSVIPWTRFHALPDDHEIHENWEPDPDDPRRAVQLERGLRAFRGRLEDSADRGNGRLWGPVHDQGSGWPVFLCDTRTERERRTPATVGRAMLLGEQQRCGLHDWLRGQVDAEDPFRPAIVMCPALLLPRMLAVARGGPAAALRSDGWDGYPASLYWLLRAVGESGLRNLVVVSGDLHLSFTATATVRVGNRPPVRVHSIHCSALHAPYPFANGRRADLAVDDGFVLRDPGGCGPPVECELKTADVTFARIREGFGRIRVEPIAAAGLQAEPAWRLQVDFVDGFNHSGRPSARKPMDHCGIELPLACLPGAGPVPTGAPPT
jgi:hypothetical protein